LLSRPSTTLGYVARSSYWTDLWHLPLLFAVQYLLMDLELAWIFKFVLASTATLVVYLPRL
jgi:glucans biosynthesis protein C